MKPDEVPSDFHDDKSTPTNGGFLRILFLRRVRGTSIIGIRLWTLSDVPTDPNRAMRDLGTLKSLP